MKRVGEFWWPDGDTHTCMVIPQEVLRLPQYLELVPKRRTVIQAGGNVGVYPLALSKIFERVVSFEPDPDNWECFLANFDGKDVESCVVAENKALADTRKTVGTYRMERERGNYGATQIKDGGDIEAITIDAYGFTDVDFLFLDIEGYEYPALLGAKDTIAATHPTISLELKNLGLTYGYPDRMCDEFLTERGYKLANRIGRDYIYTWQGHPC